MNQRLLNFFFFLSVIGLFFFTWDRDVLWPAWAYLSIACSLYLTGILFVTKTGDVPLAHFINHKKIPWDMALLFGYVLIESIFFSEWRPLTEGFELGQKIGIRALASHLGMDFLILSWVFYSHFPKIRSPLKWGIFLGGLAHSISLIIDQLIIQSPGIEKIGLMGNRSIGASFAVVWIFLSLHWFKKTGIVWALIGALAVLISHSGISYLALIFAFSAFFISRKPNDYRSWLWVSGLLPIGIALGSFVKEQWFHHISRYDAWPMFFKSWTSQANPLIGWGPGSFPYFGPNSQLQNNFMVEVREKTIHGTWWQWAHNDWLQVLLEFGVIGLILSLIVYFSLLKKSFGRPAFFGGVVAFGVTMIANYPMHIAQGALLAWFLVFETIWGEEK
jgi:O-antigen ligase